MTIQTVRVDLGARSYDVRIGQGLLDRAGAEVLALAGRRRVAILTDRTVAERHLPRLQEALRAEGIEAPALILPAGEATKSWSHLGEAVEWLIAQRIERKDLVIALGGGVIGDLAGFAAAILRRGVRFVQIPTSLLAQVDSSVGGKTGINSPQGKNLIGAFHQPALVLADIDVLATLSPRDFRAGYGEVAKYGLLGDESFFDWLEAAGPTLSRDPAALQRAVHHSVAMKAGIVQRDETEQGERALLNLGHTFGHAVETEVGFDEDALAHGEAVGLGCCMAFRYSAREGLCSAADVERVEAAVAAAGLPIRLDQAGAFAADRLLALMAGDKKAEGGALTLILARGIGRAFVAKGVDAAKVRAFLIEEGASA